AGGRLLAGGGQDHAGAAAVDHRRAEDPLQLLHAGRQRWLGHVRRLGRAAERAVLGEQLQVLELAQGGQHTATHRRARSRTEEVSRKWMAASASHGLCPRMAQAWATSKEAEALSDPPKAPHHGGPHHGPWSHPPEPAPVVAPPQPRRLRLTRGLIVWLGVMALGIALYVGLTLLFPGQLDRQDEAGAIQLLGWLALVSSGLVFARRMRFGEVVRNIAIWGAIAGVAILGYSFRDEAVAAFQRVRGELIPAMAAPAGDHAMTITASDDNGFYVMGQVNGATVRFAIDTGANGVVLSPADAARAGVDVDTLKFASPTETANGVGYAAPVTLQSLTVGQIKLANVPAAVDKAPMTTSLLGMAFLKRLDS